MTTLDGNPQIDQLIGELRLLREELSKISAQLTAWETTYTPRPTPENPNPRAVRSLRMTATIFDQTRR